MDKTKIINDILLFTTEFDRKYLETKPIEELKDYSEQLMEENKLREMNNELKRLNNLKNEIDKEIKQQEYSIQNFKLKHNLD